MTDLLVVALGVIGAIWAAFVAGKRKEGRDRDQEEHNIRTATKQRIEDALHNRDTDIDSVRQRLRDRSKR